MAMIAGLRRPQVSEAEHTAWLEGFKPLVHACGDMGMPDGYARLVNINHTLRALYFLVRHEVKSIEPALAAGIGEMLLEFSQL